MSYVYDEINDTYGILLQNDKNNNHIYKSTVNVDRKFCPIKKSIQPEVFDLAHTVPQKCMQYFVKFP